MTAGNRQKPKKPKDFALTPHNCGRWCKKIKGVIYYFGPWDDPDGSLREYVAIKDSLQLGIDPRRAAAQPATTLDEMVNVFLDRCDQRRQDGELSALSFRDYRETAALLVQHFGRNADPCALRPLDFAGFRKMLTTRFAAGRASKSITVTRMAFKWAFESEVITAMPRLGPDFKAVKKGTTPAVKKLFTPAEARALLKVADAKWKALVYLGLNAAYGNSDVSRLTLGDVQGEWLDVPRRKTGVDRRAWLWKETRDAIADYLKVRPKPKPGNEDVLFLTTRGTPLVTIDDAGVIKDTTIVGFRKLAKDAGIHRPRMGYYWCRHSFRTVADECRDQPAANFVMGHSDGGMAANYRHEISDERLKRISQHVRKWLHG